MLASPNPRVQLSITATACSPQPYPRSGSKSAGREAKLVRQRLSLAPSGAHGFGLRKDRVEPATRSGSARLPGICSCCPGWCPCPASWPGSLAATGMPASSGSPPAQDTQKQAMTVSSDAFPGELKSDSTHSDTVSFHRSTHGMIISCRKARCGMTTAVHHLRHAFLRNLQLPDVRDLRTSM